MDCDILPKKILLVDDDLTMQKIINLSLNRAKPDIELTIISSGEEAIEAADSLNPEMVILDYRLNGMDGIQTYQKLQEIEKFQNIPFVFMSGENDLDVMAYNDNKNIKGIIKKPFRPAELGNELCELLLA